MRFRDDLTAEYVRSLLTYNPETGGLTWKHRVDISDCDHVRRGLGTFDTKAEATAAYEAAGREQWGDHFRPQ